MSLMLLRKNFGKAIWIGLALLSGVGWSTLSAATLPAGFVETQFGSNLGGSPTAMAFAPDGRLFVCVQGGQLRVIKNGALLPTPFVSLSVSSSSERGLLGIAFDPNFATNQFVYLYYTTSTAPIHNRISRFTANGDVAVAGSEVVLVDLENLTAGNHNGGAIHFGPDGKLYAAVGENAVPSNAQTLNNRLGKMLRYNSDGSIPTDNPFYNTATGANRAIWALGLRNPYTFSFQPGTGRMFINDVGQSTWEEINDGIAGSNYGWPACEGVCSTPNPNFRNPLFQYENGDNGPTTGCAIVGAAFYNPPVHQFPSSYLGKFFFAEVCSGWIRVFDPASGSASPFASGISGPVDLQVGPDGCLYYLARGNNGQVFRVSAVASQPLNISVRSRVGAGNDVMISGFIITTGAAKKVILRGMGPSLQQAGVADALPDPFLELHAGDSSLISTNNNWRDNTPADQLDITNNQLAPSNDLESVIVATLQPGTYSVIVRGQGNTGGGVGLVEVYDMDRTVTSRLANISGRASVQTGTNVLISGFIVGQNIGAAKVIVRGIGPSLAQAGINDPLPDPILELRDNNGALVIANDNWQDDANQAAQISANGLAPASAQESAVSTSLLPGTYTAIVAGKNGGTGVGLVEVYNLP